MGSNPPKKLKKMETKGSPTPPTCSSANRRLKIGLVTAHWLAVLLDMDSNSKMLNSVSIRLDKSVGSRVRCPLSASIAGESLLAFLKRKVAR